MLVIPPGVSPQRCRASPAPAWRRAPRSAPHAHDGVDVELAEGRAKFDREAPGRDDDLRERPASGRMGRLHAASIAAHPRARLAWVVDPHREAAAALASLHGARRQGHPLREAPRPRARASGALAGSGAGGGGAPLRGLQRRFDPSFRALHDAVELLPVRPFYRLLWPDGDSFEYGAELEQTLEQIRARSPRDAEGYLRFLEYSRQNFEAGYQGLVATPFLRLWDMAAAVPQLLRLRSDRSVYQSVARFVTDERLRQALSFHTLLIGGNPFETSSIYTLIHYLEREWGVHYPRGGTGALVRALARLFTDLGGTLLLSTPVEAVELRGDAAHPRHQVTAAAWQGEPFDLVVSNADLHHTYARLYRHHAPARPMARRLERMTWSMSLFILYLGIDRVYDGLHQHTILFGPRYEGLLGDIFHGRRLPEDFSLYLHAPTVTDPSLAPPGCSSLYALSPVPHLGRAAVDWQRVAPQYGDRILAFLEGTLPQLRRHVVVRSHFTPLDFESQLGAYLGNGFSVAPLLRQSAYLRPHNRDPRIPGLYIAGAGTHPGAGVPGVINSAKATARVILEDFMA